MPKKIFIHERKFNEILKYLLILKYCKIIKIKKNGHYLMTRRDYLIYVQEILILYKNFIFMNITFEWKGFEK